MNRPAQIAICTLGLVALALAWTPTSAAPLGPLSAATSQALAASPLDRTVVDATEPVADGRPASPDATSADLSIRIVPQKAAGGSQPNVWEPVAQFVEEGTVSLLRPYGPYLTPCWEAPDGAIEGQPECWTTETDTTAVVWRAPDEQGAYTVRLVVSEGTTFVGQEVVLRVGETPDNAEPTETPTPEPTETATPPRTTAGRTATTTTRT